MPVYEIDVNTGTPLRHAVDRKAVKQVLKTIHPDLRAEVLINLVDIPIRKSDIVGYLNGRKPESTRLRQWRVSRRGRLMERTGQTMLMPSKQELAAGIRPTLERVTGVKAQRVIPIVVA